MKISSSKKLLFIIEIFFTSLIYGQNPRWINYTNGADIYALAEEGNFVWAGTSGGIAKINKGTGAVTFYNRGNSGIPDNYISCIAIDKWGNKWFGASGLSGYGLIKFDGTKWTIYNTSNSKLPNNHVSQITSESNGNLWLATNQRTGLTKFDGTNWTTYTKKNSGLPSDNVRCITIDGSGKKWIGTDTGVVTFDGTNWTLYCQRNSGLPWNDVRDIAIDAVGDKWIAVYDGGIVKYDGVNWTVFKPSKPVIAIEKIKIAGNNKWIIDIGVGGGLFKFDNSTWTVYNSSNTSLPNGAMGALLVDNSGNKWLGAFHSGVYKFDNTNWTNYNTSNCFLKNNVSLGIDINKRTNVKWIADYGGGSYGSGGVMRVNGNNWTYYSTAPGCCTYWVKIENDSTVWAGLWKGVGKLVNSAWTFYDMSNSGLPSNDVRSFAIDTFGNKWFGTMFGGLAKFDGTNWIVYNTGNSPIPSNRITSLAYDSANILWIGTDTGGVATFDGTNWKTYNKSNSGITNNYITVIAIDNLGNKWIGTDNEVAEFDGTKWIVYNTSNSGIACDWALTIAFDRNNNKWFGANNTCGMTKFDGTNWTNYNISNSGIPCNDVRSLAVDTFGYVWIATDLGGIGVYDENGIPLGIDNLSISVKTISKIFPNPFSFQTNIQTGKNLKDATIEVYDLFGQKVKELKSINANAGQTLTLTRDKLSSGLYFLRLIEDEKIIATEKLLICE